jgi:ubiquinone biosynthesis protein
VRDELEAIVPTLLPLLQGLPRRLDRITEAMERNEIVLGVHLFPEERDRRFATRLMAPLVVTVAGASAGVIGSLLILAANPRLATDAGRMLQALGIGCVAVALLALLRSRCRVAGPARATVIAFGVRRLRHDGRLMRILLSDGSSVTA